MIFKLRFDIISYERNFFWDMNQDVLLKTGSSNWNAVECFHFRKRIDGFLEMRSGACLIFFVSVGGGDISKNSWQILHFDIEYTRNRGVARHRKVGLETVIRCQLASGPNEKARLVHDWSWYKSFLYPDQRSSRVWLKRRHKHVEHTFSSLSLSERASSDACSRNRPTKSRRWAWTHSRQSANGNHG